jgi:hypothetical protein
VRQEKDYVLGYNNIMFSNYYTAWKDRAKKIALKCWKLVIKEEQALYGSESYLTNLGLPSSWVSPSDSTHQNLHPADVEVQEGKGGDPMQGLEGSKLSHTIYLA